MPTGANERFTRRAFLVGGAATGGLVLVAPWSSRTDPERESPAAAEPSFLTAAERVTVAAIVGRLIPGSDADPGAVEAGVVDYIDRKLATDGFAEPTFVDGPFVEVVEKDPGLTSTGALVVARSQLYRYGYQSAVLPREMYREGMRALDRLASTRFGARFAALAQPDQDAVLTVLDDIRQAAETGSSDDQETGSGNESSDSGGSQRADAAREFFGDLDPGQFFTTLHTDAIEGMFSDPSYSGNQGMVGWVLIGYPGPQRSYSPTEMLRGTRRLPQPHDHLPPMNPDRPDSDARGALEQPRSGVRDG